jgi:hypothetical protein
MALLNTTISRSRLARLLDEEEQYRFSADTKVFEAAVHALAGSD